MDLESMSIGYRDALLLFRTLCKVCLLQTNVFSQFICFRAHCLFLHCLQMGMKEDNDEVTTKSRILSLELLQVFLIFQFMGVCSYIPLFYFTVL